MNIYIKYIYILLVIQLLVFVDMKAQNESEPFLWNEQENPLLWFNPKLIKNQTTKHYNAGRYAFDTTNYCRTRTSKIKALSIYEFKTSSLDSTIIAKIEYSPNGLTKNWESKLSMNDELIYCNKNTRGKMKEKSTIRLKESDTKHIYKTDSIGRVKLYSRKYRGPINKLIKKLNGLPAYKRYYFYSIDGKEIIEAKIVTKEELSFYDAQKELMEYKIYRFDEDMNLLSIIYYTYENNIKSEALKINLYYEYY